MESLELEKFWKWLGEDEVCENCLKPSRSYLCPKCQEKAEKARKEAITRELMEV